MELHKDEKWKAPKREGRNECIRCRSSRQERGRSGALLHERRGASTRRGCSFTRRCASLVKEQRARFYIMRRCVTMLICWREYQDS